MIRAVEPEILDGLAPDDPLAIGARRDLRRLNRILRHEILFEREMLEALTVAAVERRPFRLVELGAGDGSTIRLLAGRCRVEGLRVEGVLVDRLELVTEETLRALADSNWHLETIAMDAAAWLSRPPAPADMVIANLFLHHFSGSALSGLLGLISAMTNRFVACEPRRSMVAMVVSRMLRVIGCNATTRHDAPVSVRAGFAGSELSSLWPADSGWALEEGPIGFFSHRFIARKHA